MVATIMPTFVLAAPVRPLPTAPAVVEYPEGPLLNFETMAFITDAAGHLIIGSGYQVWIQWCCKVCYATRFAHRAYSGRYGIELGDPNDTRLGSDAELVKIAYQRSLVSSLKIDPRTGSVTAFRFQEIADLLRVTCTIAPTVPAVGPAHDIETWLTLPGRDR